MIDADYIRGVISAQDRSRPRSQQKRIGPSDLSSPCNRKLVYQLLGIPAAVDDSVNLAAWVGTGIHKQMEDALKRNKDWLTEARISIDVTDEVKLSGSADAYHIPSGTVVDYKTVGPSALAKYRNASPEKYRMQIAIYGLGIALAGHPVNTCALVYIPRNGALSDIHVDAHPWDQDLAEAAIRRYEDLLVAATIGPEAIPMMSTAADCRFCPWWIPGWPGDEREACSGHEKTTGIADGNTHNTREIRKTA